MCKISLKNVQSIAMIEQEGQKSCCAVHWTRESATVPVVTKIACQEAGVRLVPSPGAPQRRPHKCCCCCCGRSQRPCCCGQSLSFHGKQVKKQPSLCTGYPESLYYPPAGVLENLEIPWRRVHDVRPGLRPTCSTGSYGCTKLFIVPS